MKHGRVLLVLMAIGVSFAGSFPLASTAAVASPAGSWAAVAPMNVPRAGHTLTLLRDGRVLATGGLTGDLPESATRTAEIYTPSTDTWTVVAPMAVARFGHTATLLRSRRVFVFGQGGGEIYTPWTNRWSSVAPTLQDRDDDATLRSARRGPSASLV